MRGQLVMHHVYIMYIYFQSYLCSFCTISSGLRVQFRYLLANLRKIYIHDVKNKYTFFEPKMYHQLVGYLGFTHILLDVKFVNILKYSNKKTVLHLQNINLLWNLNSE